MEPSRTHQRAPSADESHQPIGPLVELADVPVPSCRVTLSSGRHYELRAEEQGDRLTVRGRGGQVVLRVQITEQGPVLSFESADIQLTASRHLGLTADSVSVEARTSLHVHSGGDSTETVVGNRHATVAGTERLEAGALEIQASEHGMALRAAGKIALDGDHIGLNDAPCPVPFPWSALAAEEEKTCPDGGRGG